MSSHIVTRVQAGQPRNRGSICGRGNKYITSPALGLIQPPVPLGLEVFLFSGEYL
jgi:hypothetical protein